MGRRASGWSRAALVALVVSIPGASGFGISGVSPLAGMAKVGVTGMGLRAGALPGGRAASAGGLPGQRRSGRGAATIRAAFVPDKENMDLTNSQPDHPVLKDPCYIKDRMTGEEVKIYSNGACVTSYLTPDYDVFFVRPDAVLDGSKPISGGVPFCWPQFGPGEIQQHGFLRNQKWTLVDWCQENAGGSFSNSFSQDAARAVYEIYDTKYSYDMWKRKFFARYSAHLTGGQLLLDFRVKNLDTKQIEFTGALHTYYAVRDIDSIEIRGNFKGLTYLDKVAGEEKVETRESITIKEAVDSVYYGMTGTVTLVDGDRSVEITPDGDEWTDLVLWNPYGDDKMGYKNFVCIENAVAKDPAVIPVGEYWCSKVSIKPLVNGMPAFLQSLGDD